jgi:glutathionyl-hydroquinone reductase
MLTIPGIAGTVSIDHIKRGYYSVKTLNPTSTVPLGQLLGFAHLLNTPSHEGGGLTPAG